MTEFILRTVLVMMMMMSRLVQLQKRGFELDSECILCIDM